VNCEDCNYYYPRSAEEGYCDKRSIIVSWNDEYDEECEDECENDSQLEMFGDFSQAIKVKNQIEKSYKSGIGIGKLVDLIIDVRESQQNQFDNYATFFNIDNFSISEVENIIESLERNNYLATVLDKTFMSSIYEMGQKIFNGKGKHWLLIMDMSDDYEYDENGKYHYKTQPHWTDYIQTK
jgi:hypothetical protein